MRVSLPKPDTKLRRIEVMFPRVATTLLTHGSLQFVTHSSFRSCMLRRTSPLSLQDRITLRGHSVRDDCRRLLTFADAPPGSLCHRCPWSCTVEVIRIRSRARNPDRYQCGFAFDALSTQKEVGMSDRDRSLFALILRAKSGSLRRMIVLYWSATSKCGGGLRGVLLP